MGFLLSAEFSGSGGVCGVNADREVDLIPFWVLLRGLKRSVDEGVDHSMGVARVEWLGDGGGVVMM